MTRHPLPAEVRGALRGTSAEHVTGVLVPELEGEMEINELCKRAYATASEKGWYDNGEPNFGERLMLIVTEVAEAMEEWRNGHDVTEVYVSGSKMKPEGVPIELADVVIRIADLCGRHGIDLRAAIEQKMAYNASRPYRHGGKAA